MEFLPYGSFSPAGELLRRLMMSYSRLEGPLYGAEIFDKSAEENPQWPGDWEGRTILAVVMLAKATGREPENLKPLLQELEKRINQDGYMGPLIQEGRINEQLLAGNSWVMRGLCELYEWRRDEKTLEAIRNMAEGLFLKTSGTYAAYPITKGSRQQGEGREGGNLTGEVNQGWLSSTDIGCAFIMLDGASHAYHLLRTPQLRELITDMISRFAQADLTGATFQTHATLSAVRGILRFYEDTGEEKWLELAKKVFAYYAENGMTENYANHNWFGRPEWTEPCAIVDSLLSSATLWRMTREPGYLELAHNILYNALYYAQRANGGFGCDNCAGAFEPTLRPSGEASYEAWWCCTMRGADGLSNAASYMAAEEMGTLYLPFYQEGVFTAKGLKLRETTAYPYTGRVTLEVLENTGEVSSIAFYRPSFVRFFHVQGGEIAGEDSGFVTVKGSWLPGDRIEVIMELSLWTADARSPAFEGWQTLRYGTLLLAAPSGSWPAIMPDLDRLVLEDAQGAVFAAPDGRHFSPVGRMTFTSKEEILSTPLQVLFEARSRSGDGKE